MRRHPAAAFRQGEKPGRSESTALVMPSLGGSPHMRRGRGAAGGTSTWLLRVNMLAVGPLGIYFYRTLFLCVCGLPVWVGLVSLGR